MDSIKVEIHFQKISELDLSEEKKKRIPTGIIKRNHVIESAFNMELKILFIYQK